MYSEQLVKTIVKSLIRSHPHGEITESEVIKELEVRENIDVGKLLKEFGQEKMIDLISQWEEFIVNWTNFNPTIQTKQGDHISEMNKYLKRKSGTALKNKTVASYFNTMRVSMRRDFLAFSPDSSTNSVFNEDNFFDDFHDNRSTLSFDKADFEEFLKEPNSFNMNKIYDSSKCSEEIEIRSSEIPTKDINTAETPNSSNIRTLSNSTVHQMNQFDLNEATTSDLSTVPPIKISAFNNPMNKKKSSIDYKLIKSIDQMIPSCKTLDPSIISIVVLEIVNPHRFWFADYNEYKELSELMNQMQDFYKIQQDLFHIDIHDAKRGLYVAALFNNMWHRCMIIKKVDNTNFVRVFYVDFGTVETVSISDVCYLKEDFSNFPAIARRGVLAYIQPKFEDIWTDKAILFIKSCVSDKKIEAKIFDLNLADNSYYLALKYKISGIPKLLTSALIVENFARVDLDFMENGIISADSFDFAYYEDGRFLDQELESQSLVAFDSWIPSSVPRVNQKNFTPNLKYKSQSAEKSIGNQISTPRNVLKNSKSESGEKKLKRNLTNEFNSHNIVDKTSPSSTKTNSIKSFKPKFVKSQTFQKLVVGSETKICVNKIYSPSSFYFFLEQEIKEIKEFLDNMNHYYSDKENLEIEESDFDKEIVVLNDGNYCRGRVNCEIGGLYQIFLIDFGVFVLKKATEIYKLRKEFVKRQCCVYKGSVHHSFAKKLIPKTFINVKILAIESNEIVSMKPV